MWTFKLRKQRHGVWMESLSRETQVALDQVIAEIEGSEEYQRCMELKEEMSQNPELLELIQEVKEYQKKYIRGGYSDFIKRELDQRLEKLDTYSVYVEYNHYLEKVNQNIDVVRDFLNEYFRNLTSENFEEGI